MELNNKARVAVFKFVYYDIMNKKKFNEID